MKTPSTNFINSYPACGPSGAPKRRRRSMRLRGYDYSTPGFYFVTICTRNRLCVLGDVANGRMRLSEAGRLAQAEWEGLPLHYPHVQLGVWTIMPNHLHGIVALAEGNVGPDGMDAGGGDGRSDADVGAGLKPAPTDVGVMRQTLPEIVRAFKTFSAKCINAFLDTAGAPFWQRNYYGHVIRDQAALDRVRQYIMDNPARWDEDPDNPDAASGGTHRNEDPGNPNAPPGRGGFETRPYGAEETP